MSVTTGFKLIVDNFIGSLSFDSAFPSMLIVRMVNNLAPLFNRSFELNEQFEAKI